MKAKVTPDDLRSRFHMPLKMAAAELGISVTRMKTACRANGLKAWPYREAKRAGNHEHTATASKVLKEADAAIHTTWRKKGPEERAVAIARWMAKRERRVNGGRLTYSKMSEHASTKPRAGGRFVKPITESPAGALLPLVEESHTAESSSCRSSLAPSIKHEQRPAATTSLCARVGATVQDLDARLQPAAPEHLFTAADTEVFGSTVVIVNWNTIDDA